MPTPVRISNDRHLLDPLLSSMDEDESAIMSRWLLTSSEIWVAMVRDELACCWGLVTPTLLSFETYLWMYHTKLVEEHKFMFVRNSQLVIEQILEEYPVIYGHVKSHAEESKRWLRWLGAKIEEPIDGFRRFEIRKRSDG